MKDYKEMADDVLRRRDVYFRERRRMIRRTASLLSCFCIVAVLGIAGWHSVTLIKNDSNKVMDVQPHDNFAIQETSDEVKHLTEKQESKSSIQDFSAEMSADGSEDVRNSDTGNNNEAESTGTGTSIDVPVSDIPGDTGELTAYDEVWGGSYMDENGRWVVWLTEDTSENRLAVFQLNPALNENNTIFRKADYSRAYLTYLMAEISKAMGSDGVIPFVTTAALREDRNRVEVTMVTDDPSSVAQVLAFDSTGGAIEITFNAESQVITNLIKEIQP